MKPVRLFVAGIIAAFAGNSQAALADPAEGRSDIADDKNLVFFRTSAWFNNDDRTWRIPIHGWVYEPQNSAVRKAAFARILRHKYHLVADTQAAVVLAERLNLLISDNKRGKHVRVRLHVQDRTSQRQAGMHGEREEHSTKQLAEQIFTMPRSAANGHFHTTLIIPEGQVAPMSGNNILQISAISATATPGVDRVFTGEVRLIAPAGVSVISDIDDTVKISEVRDRRRLLEHTFFKEFIPVPGMAERYQRWSEAGASLHFVSSSPWQLYAPLLQFAEQSGFPWASFSLKPVRFRDQTLLDLFKPGTITKPAAIEAILNAYPHQKFVLVGDSGEQDPEVYAQLAGKHPEQVTKIYIRNVSGETATNARFSQVFANLDGQLWRLFDHASELPGQPLASDR